MDSLNDFKYVFILALILLLSGCSNIYWGSVKNTTNEVVKVKLTFKNEYGTHYLELPPLKPMGHELWDYEQSSLTITKIDKNLSRVEATNNEGCTITFDRAAIDKKVENHELEIVIEPQDFIDACGIKANKTGVTLNN